MDPAKPIVRHRELITTDLLMNFLEFNVVPRDDQTLIAWAARLPKWVMPRTLNSRHLEKCKNINCK